MGWLYTQGQSRKELVDEIIKPYETEKYSQKVLAHCYRGNPGAGVLYFVTEREFKTEPKVERWVGVYLLRNDRGYGWGYKDMDETVGPNDVSCPLSYLDQCTEPMNEYSRQWREKVRAWHAQQKQKLTVRKALQDEAKRRGYKLRFPAHAVTDKMSLEEAFQHVFGTSPATTKEAT